MQGDLKTLDRADPHVPRRAADCRRGSRSSRRRCGRRRRIEVFLAPPPVFGRRLDGLAHRSAAPTSAPVTIVEVLGLPLPVLQAAYATGDHAGARRSIRAKVKLVFRDYPHRRPASTRRRRKRLGGGPLRGRPGQVLEVTTKRCSSAAPRIDAGRAQTGYAKEHRGSTPTAFAAVPRLRGKYTAAV